MVKRLMVTLKVEIYAYCSCMVSGWNIHHSKVRQINVSIKSIKSCSIDNVRPLDGFYVSIISSKHLIISKVSADVREKIRRLIISETDRNTLVSDNSSQTISIYSARSLACGWFLDIKNRNQSKTQGESGAETSRFFLFIMLWQIEYCIHVILNGYVFLMIYLSFKITRWFHANIELM